MNNKVEEREISIIDLMYFILKEWRKLIVACVLGAMLFASLYVIKNIDTAGKSEPKVTSETESEQSVQAVAMENLIEDNTKILDSYNVYRDNSIIMQLNPYNTPVIMTDFTVDVDDDKSLFMGNGELYTTIYNDIINLYINYFDTENDWKKIEEITGKEEKYLKEIIVFQNTKTSNLFSMNVFYYDEETLKKIYDVVIDTIENLNEKVSKASYKHSLSYEKGTPKTTFNNNVLSAQNSILNDVRTKTNLIDDLNTKYEKLKKSGKAVVVKKSLKTKTIIKYMIIGAFIGCFIIAFWYFCIYIFKGFLHTDDELKSMYGIEHFGTIKGDKKGKRNNPIDKLIRKIFKHYVYNDSEEEAFNRISVFINNIESKIITFISAGDENIAKDYVEKLKKYVIEKQLVFLGNPVKSAEVVKELSKCDSIVFIEELEKSKVSDINLEYSLVNSLSKMALGYIICT